MDVRALTSSPRSLCTLVAFDGDRWGPQQSWAFEHEPAVRATKSQLAVGLSLDLVALLVDGADDADEQHREVDSVVGPP